MTYTIYQPRIRYSLNQQTSSCIYYGQLTSKLKIIYYKHTVYLQFHQNNATLPWLKLSWTDCIIWYGPGFNSTSPEIFKLLVIFTFKCCKFNSYVNTTSKLTKNCHPQNFFWLNPCHHAYSFCLQHVSKSTILSGATHLKKFLRSDDTAEFQSCFKRKLINQEKNRVS